MVGGDGAPEGHRAVPPATPGAPSRAPRFLDPSSAIDAASDRRGLRAFRADGIATQLRETLLGGPILVGYVLLLGASHATLGLLAAIGPLSQVLQFPAVARLHRTRRRKALVWHAALVSRLAWAVVVASPWIAPTGWRLPVLLIGVTVATGLGTVGGAAWTPWIRDFLTPGRIGPQFAHRLALATAVALPAAVAAGVYIDRVGTLRAAALPAYTIVLGLGVMAGLAGMVAIARIPEPRMAPEPAPGWSRIVSDTLANRDERQVVAFLASWTFAVNLASPFYTVYLLERVGLPMLWVIILAAISQGATAIAVRSWGRLAEQFSIHTVLRVSGILFLATVAAWPVLGRIGDRGLLLVCFAAAHAIAGLAAGGVTLGTTTIALEVAPPSRAGEFLAFNATCSGVASGVAPLLGGVASSWLAGSQLDVAVRWSHETVGGALVPVHLRGLDFLFLASAALGLYAIHRLLAIPERERGASHRAMAALAEELQLRARAPVRMLSTVPGLRGVVELPHRLAGRIPRSRRATTATN